MVLLVLEAHRALHFCRRIDERAEGIAGQRMVVATGIHIFEFAGLIVTPLGIRPLKQESLNFVGRVQCVLLFLVELFRDSLSARRGYPREYGEPSLSMTSPNTRTLPLPKMSAGAQ